MALRIALDTNRYTDLCRGDPEVAEILYTAQEIFLPFVVIAELRAGFALGRHASNNERTLQRFLAKPGVQPIFAGDATTNLYADVYSQLRKQGTPIPTNDIWIAALTVEHNLTLFSRDSHFDNLPQINVI
ncbi:MAG: type II toxin-antitoxin system VapC family toxin [Pseudomonadota bacterium]|nr:type II toxin-antitoxin system VapC family toxin [Pseudomonadota bacterium]